MSVNPEKLTSTSVPAVTPPEDARITKARDAANQRQGVDLNAPYTPNPNAVTLGGLLTPAAPVGPSSSGMINGPAYVNPTPGTAPNPNYGNEGGSVPEAKTNNYLPSLATMIGNSGVLTEDGKRLYLPQKGGEATPASAPAPVATTVPLDPGVTPGLPQLAPQMSVPGTQPVQPTQPVQNITQRPVPQGDGTPPPGGGIITIGGKTITIPPTGPTGIPTGGMINPQGNNMAATTQMQGELERARADNAYNNDLNQQSLANSQASVSAREDKEAKWEKEVADSSILNRVNSGDSPALMAAKTALAGQRNQAFDERAKNKGMIRGQDLRAKADAMQNDTTRHGQNIQGEVAKAGNALTARGQDITAATSRDNNTASNTAHMEAAKLQAQTSTQNTATNAAAHLEAAQAQGKISGLQQEITQQGTFYSWLEMNPKTKTFEFKTNKPMTADKKAK